jgi:hypothetical protein
VGANRWVHAAGDHNDWTPPVNWDGVSIGMRGGPPAGHQRSSYVAVDGRMYVTSPLHSRRWDVEIASQPGDRYAWFYDVDRGGLWRQENIADVVLGPEVPGTFGRAHLAHPSRKVLGFAGCLEPYDGRFSPGEAYFNSYDVVSNRLSVVRIPAPLPRGVGEVVDPQRDIDQNLADAAEHGFQIKYVFLTHFHADFVASHIELRDQAGAMSVLRTRATRRRANSKWLLLRNRIACRSQRRVSVPS